MIDDHIMNISHVIRDVDQLPNMGHYLILFSYLNWPLPSFAHLPSLRRFKNSQSDGDMVFSKIATLREDGYLPEAICNYFYDLDFVEDAKLEIKLFSDLANSFDLRKIFLGKLVFDFESLRHLNALYIKELSASEFRSFITPFIKNLVNDVLGEDYLIELATLFKKQISHGREILDYCLPFIDEQPLFTPSQIQFLNTPNSQRVIAEFKKRITMHESEGLAHISEMLNELQEQLNIKGKDFYMPLRLLLSHLSHGPEIEEIIRFLGKEGVLRRLNHDND